MWTNDEQIMNIQITWYTVNLFQFTGIAVQAKRRNTLWSVGRTNVETQTDNHTQECQKSPNSPHFF